MEQFDSVKTMIDKLRSEDPEARLSSMRGIHLISTTLGPERTRDELLLYLTDYLDDNDEVLRVFANALGTMVPEVGGVEYTSSLLAPLEILGSLDEVTVRDEAVASLQLIGSQLFSPGSITGSSGASSADNKRKDSNAKARGEFISMVRRLGEGMPQCRSTACSLISTVYPCADASTRADLIKLFQKLCEDDEILVRRAACVAMGKHLAGVLGSKGCSELVPVLNAFAKDESDGVRLQAVATCASLLQVLPETQHSAILLAVRSLSSDSSWRVRYMTADSLGNLAAALSPPDVVKYAVPVFRALCQDSEPEIRASAVFNMANVLAACRDATGKKDILVTGTRLVSDDVSHVRMSLASAVLKSVAHVAKDLWGTTIVPACTALLRDAEADVRLALVSGFSSMGNTPEAKELAPSLVPVVISLAADSKWRVREVVVAQVPYVITSLGRSAEQVLQVCVNRLTDRVAAIRDAAVQSCCKLVAEHGSGWAASTLLPQVQTLVTDPNYLHRVTLCHLYAALADVAAFDAATCESALWPQLVTLHTDAVPNVRLNVAKAIMALSRSDKVPSRVAKPVLRALSEDAEVDVCDAAVAAPALKSFMSKK
ncbi:putative serine/threonine protein phosphatase 2A regulatory subunit [Leishmania major strain Friedlin]|uniref:Putative serine/threonine protein phosphatase 2A regulatory subunit n=1 Tax=Leishmania major TaxID=5664 RepID=Q4QCX5_LEIMA|nr:putative serine/threonine protein phosphatase 2A regulatory subunit [Leishmania major strain Friedlin]CAG9573141.1 serine/threonine_protein_phosphatase_2A_regulatory_subunit_-_putative [Leishmania major strain Friedlin]CAJ03804.1 putative serine/threonine protein phosphatase 2A regulatory subunit [Leishmania major strain Friedlin]|eukprot:XP_001682823.1 putative serine/threonine protein phosphatase 2A regulatory subunit [Leishmania major strain Friedlin]